MSPDHDPHIRTDIVPLGDAGHLARVTVDNRTRLNVLGTDLIVQLTAAIRELELDRDLRCVVLTGAGERAFIGGADIREMVDLDTATAYQFISRLHLACAAVRKLPVPVIARIQGYCLGAGLEIAASCDLRVASDDATFGMPEVKIGIPSVIEAALLPRLIGLGKARELVYTGESISAADAERCGLVDRVVPVAGLDAAALKWVNAIGAAGARAIRLQKTLLRRWDTVPLDHAIQTGMRYFTGAYETDEPRRLMQAFLDRKRD
jgi:enoyl-CoA hydratase/carnithine racemase